MAAAPRYDRAQRLDAQPAPTHTHRGAEGGVRERLAVRPETNAQKLKTNPHGVAICRA